MSSALYALSYVCRQVFMLQWLVQRVSRLAGFSFSEFLVQRVSRSASFSFSEYEVRLATCPLVSTRRRSLLFILDLLILDRVPFQPWAGAPHLFLLCTWVRMSIAPETALLRASSRGLPYRKIEFMTMGAQKNRPVSGAHPHPPKVVYLLSRISPSFIFPNRPIYKLF